MHLEAKKYAKNKKVCSELTVSTVSIGQIMFRVSSLKFICLASLITFIRDSKISIFLWKLLKIVNLKDISKLFGVKMLEPSALSVVALLPWKWISIQQELVILQEEYETLELEPKDIILDILSITIIKIVMTFISKN